MTKLVPFFISYYREALKGHGREPQNEYHKFPQHTKISSVLQNLLTMISIFHS